MKNKKIVYFDENQQDKTMRAGQSTSKKNVSISKGLRQTSSNKLQKNMLQAARISVGDKSAGSQKIKILLASNGFIFEKKYMIYDIQCTLVKKTDSKFQITQNMPDSCKQTISPQIQQPCTSTQKLDEDYLFLNLETSSFGVTKGMVRQNFPIQRDNLNYIQVRTVGYVVQNILIYNKKIEFIQLDGSQCIDQNDLTIIQPIKLIQQGDSIRETKILNYQQRKAEGRKSKSLNFCWNLDTSLENVEVNMKSNMKKTEPEWASFFNSNNCNNQAITQRDQSNTKRMSNYSSTGGTGDKTFRGESKTNKDSSQKFNISQLMKGKEISGKPKTGSRKMLNDSGLSYGALSKGNPHGVGNGKQNKRQDVYGLEQIQHRKARTKTAQNQQITKLIQPLQLAECQLKMAELQINKHALTKKTT